MFTKDKLERWIEAINWSLFCRLETDDDAYEQLCDLQHTLEQIYTSMTSDGSI